MDFCSKKIESWGWFKKKKRCLIPVCTILFTKFRLCIYLLKLQYIKNGYNFKLCKSIKNRPKKKPRYYFLQGLASAIKSNTFLTIHIFICVILCKERDECRLGEAIIRLVEK